MSNGKCVMRNHDNERVMQPKVVKDELNQMAANQLTVKFAEIRICSRSVVVNPFLSLFQWLTT